MYSQSTTIVNATGLHARPAAALVQEAKKFPCRIWFRNVDKSGEAVNAKSLVRILGEAFTQGVEIEIAAEGEQEQEAVEALVALIDAGVGE